MINRLTSMDFSADLKPPTLLQTCAPCGGGALMSAKQAVCDVAAMFGVTPRQNLRTYAARLLLRTRIAIASAKLAVRTRNKIEVKTTKQGYLLIPIITPSGVAGHIVRR